MPTQDRFGGGGGGKCKSIITGLTDHPASLQPTDEQPTNETFCTNVCTHSRFKQQAVNTRLLMHLPQSLKQDVQKSLGTHMLRSKTRPTWLFGEGQQNVRNTARSGEAHEQACSSPAMNDGAVLRARHMFLVQVSEYSCLAHMSGDNRHKDMHRRRRLMLPASQVLSISEL